MYRRWSVSERVQLDPELVTKKLTQQEKEIIERDTRDRLKQIDPILDQILDVKIVTNQRKNFINLRVRQDYATLLFHHKAGDIYFCFFLSDKLEPFIIITAVHPIYGKLGQITRTHFEELKAAIHLFKQKYGIEGESYHYTPMDERKETDNFVASGGTSMSSKSHSSHWHLKMRIGTNMYKDRFPILQLFNFDSLRTKLEPVEYNYKRETCSHEKMLQEVEKDLKG